MVETIRGLVRPIVTIVLVAAVVYGFVIKLVTPEVFLTLVTMAMTFWFVDRLKKE